MMFLSNPIALLVTGPLVDRILEPAAATSLWQPLRSLVGAAPGSGMGALMLGAGILMFSVTALVYAHPATRSLEARLPDHAPSVQPAHLRS